MHTESFDVVLSALNIPAIDVAFTTPVLLELEGAGFGTPRGMKDYVLRNPRIVKLHLDRDWTEGVSRDELQKIARQAVGLAKRGEMEQWQDALRVVDRIHAADGTAAPSLRIRQIVKANLDDSRDWRRYGIEMEYGLDVEELLRKGGGDGNGHLKRKFPESSATAKSNKRIVLAGVDCSSLTNSLVSVAQDSQPDKAVATNSETLLSSASALNMARIHRDEIRISDAIHRDIEHFAHIKENASLHRLQ